MNLLLHPLVEEEARLRRDELLAAAEQSRALRTAFPRRENRLLASTGRLLVWAGEFLQERADVAVTRRVSA